MESTSKNGQVNNLQQKYDDMEGNDDGIPDIENFELVKPKKPGEKPKPFKMTRVMFSYSLLF